MQGTLSLAGVTPFYNPYRVYGGPGVVWGGRSVRRRRMRRFFEVLPNGEKVEKTVVVLNANEPHDFSEDESVGENEDEASVEDADADFEDAGAAEEKNSQILQVESAAPAAFVAAAESVGLSFAENARLMALRAKVLAHPLVGEKIMTVEEINCDSCGKSKAAKKPTVECDSDSESESSSDDEECVEPPKKLCPPCKVKEEKKKKIRKEVVIVCHEEPPCNKEAVSEPIVKGKCAPDACKLRDTEVTKTFESWAASKNMFSGDAMMAAAGDELPLCGNQRDTIAFIAAQSVIAERLVKEFAAKGGLKIDEAAEKKNVANLAEAVAGCKKFEGSFEHRYVSAPQSAAFAGAIDPDKHVQPLTIKASSSCTQNKAGQKFFYLSIAVKPRDGTGWSKPVDKVFRIALSSAAAPPTFHVQVTETGKAALEKQLSARASCEVLSKMYSLLSSALPLSPSSFLEK